MDLLNELSLIHSALDEALGDTDITHVESDEELREEFKVQWAAEHLAGVIAYLKAQNAS